MHRCVLTTVATGKRKISDEGAIIDQCVRLYFSLGVTEAEMLTLVPHSSGATDVTKYKFYNTGNKIVAEV